MDRRTKVFQIVGFKNSGKTTLLTEVINHWKHHHHQVGIIKHHGHGGTPSAKIEKTDTDKLLNAGAMITAVEGEGELLLQNENRKWSIEDIICVYKLFSLDLILVEGYKNASYPKAMIIKNEKDIRLLDNLQNVQAILTWIPLQKKQPYPIFSMQNKHQFIEWLYQKLMLVN
ncbi:molybdopterin-guanine dinucleotide biosynthesis protein B [Heyndrickxia sporothermodurans]